jgi:hypothetical protein
MHFALVALVIVLLIFAATDETIERMLQGLFVRRSPDDQKQ